MITKMMWVNAFFDDGWYLAIHPSGSPDAESTSASLTRELVDRVVHQTRAHGMEKYDDRPALSITVEREPADIEALYRLVDER